MKPISKLASTLLIFVTVLLWFYSPITLQGSANGDQTEIRYLPLIVHSAPPSTEWTQHAFNAQRTSYNPQSIPLPWRWKWSWNGPNPEGGIPAGKFVLPRNSQPVTGGGKVFIAAGSRGVFALNSANGQQLWNFTVNGASAYSTPAYDPDTLGVFVLFSNGTLYKLNPQNGTILAQYNSGSSSNLPLPPALTQEMVIFGVGTSVYALDKQNLQLIWQYPTASTVHTPPSYSARQNLVLIATQDLYVHAINAADGTQHWRVK
ncbi:MAG: PQQ-binding-like beta-propeller repeat protein, partial [Anaerolineales bacterium]